MDSRVVIESLSFDRRGFISNGLQDRQLTLPTVHAIPRVKHCGTSSPETDTSSADVSFGFTRRGDWVLWPFGMVKRFPGRCTQLIQKIYVNHGLPPSWPELTGVPNIKDLHPITTQMFRCRCTAGGTIV